MLPVTLLSPSSSSNQTHFPLNEAFPHLNELDFLCSDLWECAGTVGKCFPSKYWSCAAVCSTADGTPGTADIWTVSMFHWRFISLLWDFLQQDVKTKTSIFESSVETCTSSTLYFSLCLDERWQWLSTASLDILYGLSLRCDTGHPSPVTAGLLKNVSL